MTVEALKAEISKLPPDDRRQLADWIADLEEEAWDEEIARDFSPGGRGEALLNEIHEEIANGNLKRH
jgi:hypothetical protein